jgi:hypothetical protein
VRTSVKRRERLHKVGGTAVLARRMDGGEFDNVSMPCLSRVKKPREEQEEEKPPHIEHARGFWGYFNHDSPSKKGLIES